MSVSNRVKAYLEESGAEYTHHEHEPAYTAQEVAQVEHVPGQEFAKTVILTDGEGFVMAVLPATRQVDLGSIREHSGMPELRIASEDEFGGLFPNCETGAMAPFGNLYEMPVFVDQALREDETITFNAGTHVDSIKMSYSDYERLVEPVVAEFSTALV